MNHHADNLLDDVLAEAAPENFREAMFGETLRHVRRRRRFRQMRNAAGIFIALALLGIFVRQENFSQKPISAPPVAKIISPENYGLIRTQPFPARDVVTTQPLVTENFIASTATVKMIQTTTGNYRVINDEQLLALLASRPAILIRTGKNSEELVFANPEDAKGFPLN